MNAVEPIGPFDITASQIERLGIGFTEFVNRLLETELRAQESAGHLLVITSKETTADGGVDAGLREATATDWLPGGESAWQFKRSNLRPKACADELAAASWAHTYLQDGGAYIVVLGVDLPDKLIQRRRKAAADKAIELKLIAADDRDRIRVYGASALARWASRYPALAVSALAAGPGGPAIDYQRWSAGRPHSGTWIADNERENAIRAIRQQVASTEVVDIRIQGDSGIGKTRLVMEALRVAALSPLVAYVSDENQASGPLFAHLLERDRTAILVVDECPAERHVKLAEKLPDEPNIKLVTIGGHGPAVTKVPILVIGEMPTHELGEFLKRNYPQLRPEAARFVIDHARGNMRWAILLAARIADLPEAQAAELIDLNDIHAFVASVLPEGSRFFHATILALVERVGWDRDLRFQLETLAKFAGAEIDDLVRVGARMEQLGLLTRQGRYRAVEPHPLAVYLASEAWRSVGGRIVDDLLPELDEEMLLSLFHRIADLGRFEPARTELSQLLTSDGPFGSLEQIEAARLGRVLTQMAIVLPDDVARHLSELIEGKSLDDLRGQTRLRRDLVWTLQKLAWHRRTFEMAADTMLRLALAENETYTNNATGSWLDLFRTMLPATAASPLDRIEYLRRARRDRRLEVRRLAVRAAALALEPYESSMVAAEDQAGALVEPRGRPATWGDVGDYRRAAIALLSALVGDDDGDVARAAEDALIQALRPLIADQFVGDDLADALKRLQGPALQRLRTHIEDSLTLEAHMTDRQPRVAERIAALLERLPKATPVEEFALLANLPRWHFNEGELQRRLDQVVEALSPAELSDALALLERSLPAAFEVGHALAHHWASDDVLGSLITTFGANPDALVGYLGALADGGNEAVFDEFLDSLNAADLDPRTQLGIAVRGPVTPQSRARILSGLAHLSVAEGTWVLFGWQRNLAPDEVNALLDDWLNRIESQQDYAALVDWLHLRLHDESAIPGWLGDRARRLLLLRRSYPTLPNQSYDWAQIAQRLIHEHGDELAQLLLDLGEDDEGDFMLHRSSYESDVLLRAGREHPEAVWQDVATRLTQGSWRIQLTVRGWLVDVIPSKLVADWIGDDLERARLVASIATVGGDEPSAVARPLLARFGGDSQVASSLAAEFISETWMGPESAMLTGKIDQLNRWRQRTSEPDRVRAWAKQTVADLERMRTKAVEREAEGGF